MINLRAQLAWVMCELCLNNMVQVLGIVICCNSLVLLVIPEPVIAAACGFECDKAFVG